MEDHNPSPIRFLESRNNRSRLVLATFAITFILAWLIEIIVGKMAIAEPFYILLFLFFPVGLLSLVPTPISGESAAFGLVMLEGLIGWAIYIGLAQSIVRITNTQKARALYFLLIGLLIANLVGCSVSANQPI